MSPRKQKPPPLDPAGSPGQYRTFDVHLHRIIEQSAIAPIIARSEEEAEKIVIEQLEKPSQSALFVWVDGELEQTESVVFIQECNTKD